MKLNHVDNRQPQQIRVTLPAATVDKLEAYLEYANSSNGNSQGQGFMDLKQLIAEICRAFVDRGDKDFTQWLRTRTQPVSAPVQPTLPRKEKPSRKENGGERQDEGSTLLRD